MPASLEVFDVACAPRPHRDRAALELELGLVVVFDVTVCNRLPLFDLCLELSEPTDGGRDHGACPWGT
jgi:hypothetical protein